MGDGTMLQGETTSYVFDRPGPGGAWSVKLTVADDDGAPATVTESVAAQDPPAFYDVFASGPDAQGILLDSGGEWVQQSFSVDQDGRLHHFVGNIGFDPERSIPVQMLLSLHTRRNCGVEGAYDEPIYSEYVEIPVSDNNKMTDVDIEDPVAISAGCVYYWRISYSRDAFAVYFDTRAPEQRGDGEHFEPGRNAPGGDGTLLSWDMNALLYTRPPR